MKRTIRLNESSLKRMIDKTVKRALNESLSHEDRLRQVVGQYASKIKSMLDHMQLNGPNGKNYLSDLLQKEKVGFVDKLYDAMFEMEEFAKTSDQRSQEREDAAAMPPGGWERFGY